MIKVERARKDIGSISYNLLKRQNFSVKFKCRFYTMGYNNDMQYYDDEYGWIQIVAVNIDQVKEYGYGNAAVVNSTMLGSVMEIEYPDGHREKAIILDVCGKARTERIVDRWVYDGRQAQNTYGRLEGIQFKFRRFGFDK